MSRTKREVRGRRDEERQGKVVAGRLLRGLVAIAGLAAVGALVWWVVDYMRGEELEVVEDYTTSEVREPEVDIVDENNGGAVGGTVSARVKEYVVRVTDDLRYEGYEVDRVVLPYQKTREIDVYLEGRTEYYKLSIDRGSAVSAEDVGRMARHLDANGIYAEYVDLRVEGKAYYAAF